MVSDLVRKSKMEQNVAVMQAAQSYQEAWSLALEHLHPTHPTRLSVSSHLCSQPTLTGSAFILERTRKHDLEGNELPNRA